MRITLAGVVRQLALVTALAGKSAQAAPPLPLYRGIDACRDLREDGQGIEVLHFGSAALANALRNITVTPAANKAYDFASEVIEDVDFDLVLASPLAKTLPDHSHAFALSGTNTAGKYVIDYHKATAAELPTSDFLSFAVELDVRVDQHPVPSEARGFGVGLRGKAALGEFNHRAAGRLSSGVLRLLSPQNLARLPGKEGDKDDLSERIIGEMQETLPSSTALARKYLTIAPHAKMMLQDGASHTDLQTSLVLNIDQLIKDHAIVGSFIEALAQKFSLQAKVVYQLNNGLILGEAQVASTTYQTRLHFKTTDGKLLPYDRTGKSHPEAMLDLAAMQDLEATAIVELSGEVMGLRFAAKDIHIATGFHDAPIAVMNAKLVAMPVPKIDGYALGFVPTWAISAVMPGGSLDAVTQALTQGLLNGSDGRGTFAVAHIDSRTPGTNQADFTSSTELVDNFYLTFGLSVAEKYLWPNRAVIADSWQLSQAFAKAMALDMARLKQLDQANPRRTAVTLSH